MAAVSRKSTSTVLLDPWTASVAVSAGERGDLKFVDISAERGPEGPTRALSAATADDGESQKQSSSSSSSSSTSSKFNLPQPSVLHVLRTAYFGAARNSHKQIPTTAPGQPGLTPQDASTSPIVGSESPVIVREAKRPKVEGSASGDSIFGTASRRGAAALKRLCAALGVVSTQEHLPAQGVSYGVSSCRGWRVAMEDTYAAEMPLSCSSNMALFAVYDGHGGAEVARFSALHMGAALRQAPSAAAVFGPDSSPAGPATEDTPASAAAPTPPTDSPAGPSTSTANTAENAPILNDAFAASCRARSAILREAFLSVDHLLVDERHAPVLMALANPGAIVSPPEAYGRRIPGGPFLGPAAGCTATVALVARDGITVAAVGDSRCILGSRANGVIALTVDHKTSDQEELERVIRAGSWVSSSGRVRGELDMSRALGDADMKQANLPAHLQAVTADPHVTHISLQPNGAVTIGGGAQAARPGGGGSGGAGGRGGGGVDEEGSGVTGALEDAQHGREEPECYMLIASDGLWNVLDNDKVHEFVCERLEAKVDPEAICAQLCVEACVSERTAYDNVTVMLVLLHDCQPVIGPGAGPWYSSCMGHEGLLFAQGQDGDEVEEGQLADSCVVEVGVAEAGMVRDGAMEGQAAATSQELESTMAGGGCGQRTYMAQVETAVCCASKQLESQQHEDNAVRELQPDGLADTTCHVWISGSPVETAGMERDVVFVKEESVPVGCGRAQGYDGQGPTVRESDGAVAGLAERLLEASPMQEDV